MTWHLVQGCGSATRPALRAISSSTPYFRRSWSAIIGARTGASRPKSARNGRARLRQASGPAMSSCWQRSACATPSMSRATRPQARLPTRESFPRPQPRPCADTARRGPTAAAAHRPCLAVSETKHQAECLLDQPKLPRRGGDPSLILWGILEHIEGIAKCLLCGVFLAEHLPRPHQPDPAVEVAW